MIPTDVINELERCYQAAKDYSDAFNDAAKTQAELHELDPQALKKFIRARVNDKLDKLEAEQESLEQLTVAFGAVERAEERNVHRREVVWLMN